jgi:hypothetical protein
VPKVKEMEIVDLEFLASAMKCRSDRPAIVREHASLAASYDPLLEQDLPSVIAR